MPHSVIPAKVVRSHLVEFHVKGPVEVSEAAHHLRADVGVGAPFGFAQAVGLAAALGLF